MQLILLVFLSLAAGAARESEQPGASTMPTRDESRKLAEELQERLHAGDLRGVNQLLDTAAMVERVIDSSEVPFRTLESSIEGLIVSLQASAWFGREVIEALELGGDYRLLRVFEKDGERRALYRLLTSDGGLNYHEMVLARRGPAGPAKVLDVYVYLTGERLSQSYRRAFQVAAARREASRYDRLDATANGGGLIDASSILLRTSITPNVYEVQLRPAEGPVLFERHESAHEALDEIDARVGGDPYLHVQRARLFLLQENFEEARRSASRAVTEEPLLEPGYWTLATIGLETKNWGLLVEAFEGLEKSLAVEIRELADAPEYREFLESPQYKAWQARR